MSSTPSSPPAASDQLQLELDILASEGGRPAASVTDCPAAHRRDGFTILVADDDPDLRAYLMRCLCQEQEVPVKRILEAADGRAALALARQGDLDLVITDVVMPEMDGLTLCRALEADAALRDLPVLLITGQPIPKVLPRPARGVLRKPFNASKVHAWLGQLLSSPSGRSPPAPALPPRSRPAASLPE